MAGLWTKSCEPPPTPPYIQCNSEPSLSRGPGQLTRLFPHVSWPTHTPMSYIARLKCHLSEQCINYALLKNTQHIWVMAISSFPFSTVQHNRYQPTRCLINPHFAGIARVFILPTNDSRTWPYGKAKWKKTAVWLFDNEPLYLSVCWSMAKQFWELHPMLESLAMPKKTRYQGKVLCEKYAPGMVW